MQNIRIYTSEKPNIIDKKKKCYTGSCKNIFFETKSMFILNLS